MDCSGPQRYVHAFVQQQGRRRGSVACHHVAQRGALRHVDVGGQHSQACCRRWKTMRPQKLQIRPMSLLQQRRRWQPAVGQAVARTQSISSMFMRAFWGGVAFGVITFAVHSSGVIFSSVQGAITFTWSHKVLLVKCCDAVV